MPRDSQRKRARYALKQEKIAAFTAAYEAYVAEHGHPPPLPPPPPSLAAKNFARLLRFAFWATAGYLVFCGFAHFAGVVERGDFSALHGVVFIVWVAVVVKVGLRFWRGF